MTKCKEDQMFVFTKSVVKSPSTDIFIKGEIIDVVAEFTYLGWNLDSNLNFKKPVKNMTKSFSSI